MKCKLTKRTVESIQPSDRAVICHDTDIVGFQVKVTPIGRRNYQFYYRTNDGRERRPKIGEHGSITCDQARAIAKQWAAEVALGNDPSADRTNARHAQTVADLAARYIREHSKIRKKEKSIREEERLLDKIILPALGSIKVAAVRRDDIAKLHLRLRTTPYQANRVLALISKMFNLAEVWEMRGEGTAPTRNVEKYKETPRERYLSTSETERLGDAITECEGDGTISGHVAAAIRLLVLTGCRASEIRTLKWSHVDFEGACLRLPDSKSGAKVVLLNEPAMTLLTNLDRIEGNPYVVVGRKQGRHLIDIEKPWQRVRKRAGLEDVRLHDLRHTFGGFAASSGLSTPIVSKLLGHKSWQSTQRYAHLFDDPIRQATEDIGNQLNSALSGSRKLQKEADRQ